MSTATLQRSSNTFRREGSSGMVWDKKLLSELEKVMTAEPNLELMHSHSVAVGGGVSHCIAAAAAAKDGEVSPFYPRSFSAAPPKKLPPPKSVRRKLGSVFGKIPLPSLR